MNIRNALFDAAQRFANRDAVWISGNTMSYAALARAGDRIATTVLPARTDGVMVILAQRKFASYCAIFGALTNGLTYVPLNPKWPLSRVEKILALVAPDVILLDAAVASSAQGRQIADRWMGNIWRMDVDARGNVETHNLREASQSAERRYELDDFAYVMFTSGSTGIPKGVPIQARSLSHYAESMMKIANFDERERIIQAVELTFDLSMHDMSLCWAAGAMLIVVPEANAPLVPRFVQQLEATSCLCVPSAAAQAKNLLLLRPGTLPSLKTSFFVARLSLLLWQLVGWKQPQMRASTISMVRPKLRLHSAVLNARAAARSLQTSFPLAIR